MADITITKAENGKSISVHIGDTITLRLPEKSTAGYQWTPSQIDEKKVNYTKHHDAAAGQQPGSEQPCTFTFTAKATGIVSLQLAYWRPWEGASSVRNRYTITLDIQPS